MKKIKKFHKSLIEVYFPFKTNKYVTVKTGRSSIIKVGSFYEGTKNNFPDEFDFIFLLWCTRQDKNFNKEHAAYTTIRSVISCHKKSLKYTLPSGTHERRELYVDKYVMEHGPAAMLQFIYNNGLGDQRYINVDLVPAYRIVVGSDNWDWYKEYINMCVKPKSFREEVLSAGNYLKVNRSISVTETEVHFMRNILSKKHVTMYRILKFLLNGHGDGETMKLYRFSIFGINETYSSYQIKTMMIYHHDECRSPHKEEIGECVIQILQDLCTWANLKKFPKFFGSDVVEFHLLLPYLKSLMQVLKSMRTAYDSYDYEKVKMKSLSRQYLEDLDGDDPDNVEWFKFLDTIVDADPSEDSLRTYLLETDRKGRLGCCCLPVYRK